MNAKQMVKYLFENQHRTAYRKSNPNIRFDLKEIGYASQHVTDPDEKPSTNLKDYFLRLIDGNLVIGPYDVTLSDMFSDDFEIEVPFTKGDKIALERLPKETIDCVMSFSDDKELVFNNIVLDRGFRYYEFIVNTRDNLIAEHGVTSKLLLSYHKLINRKL